MSLTHALNMGSRSLSAQQRGVSTAGHNIANQNTEGFSRQEVSTRAAQADPSGLGAGAEALPTKRVYDQFLQRKILQESPRSGRYGVREDVLTKLEIIFDEMNNNGLRRSMNDFWDLGHSSPTTQNLTPLGQKQETWEIDWQLDFETLTPNFVAYATKLIRELGPLSKLSTSTPENFRNSTAKSFPTRLVVVATLTTPGMSETEHWRVSRS